jgi:hypothetical protein
MLVRLKESRGRKYSGNFVIIKFENCYSPIHLKITEDNDIKINNFVYRFKIAWNIFSCSEGST